MVDPMARLPEEQTKWEFLQKAPFADARNPEIRARAEALWRAAGGNVVVFAQLAHALARDGVRYATDTARVGTEDIAGFTREPTPSDAVDALHRGRDDCDAKARLFVALCLAQGVPAEMVDYWKPTNWANGASRLAHVAAKVRLGERWYPVELTLARARLGERGEQVPKEADGTWRN